MQGGNIATGNGTGAQSIYGTKFEDEQHWIPHKYKGLVSMVNDGQPNTNGAQFFITFGPKANLDGKNVCFGRVIHGYEICLDAQCVRQSVSGHPDLEVVIQDSGEMSPKLT